VTLHILRQIYAAGSNRRTFSVQFRYLSSTLLLSRALSHRISQKNKLAQHYLPQQQKRQVLHVHTLVNGGISNGTSTVLADRLYTPTCTMWSNKRTPWYSCPQLC